MQIVIDIPEDEYTWLKEHPNSIRWSSVYTDSILNGTPLPKGHGNLVDFDKLCEEYWDGNYLEIHCNELASIHPIIEADRKEEVREESQNYRNNSCNQYKNTNDDDFVPLFCDENIDCCDDW